MVWAACAISVLVAPVKGWCLYVVDQATATVWRSNVDGSHQETVVRFGKPGAKVASILRLAWTGATAKQRGALHFAGVPAQAGYIVLDGSKPGSAAPPTYAPSVPYQERDTMFSPGKLRYLDIGTLSPWVATVTFKRWEIEPGHSHPAPSSVRLVRGSIARVLRFTTLGENRLVAIFSDDTALVQADSKLVRWNLKNDGRQILASTQSATVWPRDLSLPERMKPIANAYGPGGGYQWVMKNPDDIRIRPEYLRKPRAKR